jgi:uncharacterized protein (TIGR02271 family)
VENDEELTAPEEQRLFEYYSQAGGTATTTLPPRRRHGHPGLHGDRENVHGTVGHDTSGPTTDNAMTRSEEQLRVGTERVEAGRARLRKYITTETETRTVPVAKETVRVEREPITDANMPNAMSGPAISEEEHEVVLTEERPVVQKEAVPGRARAPRQGRRHRERPGDGGGPQGADRHGRGHPRRARRLPRRRRTRGTTDADRLR